MSRNKREPSKAPKGHRRRFGPGVSRFLWVGGLFFILAVVVSMLLVGGLLPGSGKAGGDVAPDITLATTEGDYGISEQRGNVVVLYYSFPG